MKINREMRSVAIFYDGDCGLCVCVVKWLKKQKLRMAVDCMPYQEKEAIRRFPELMEYTPWKHVVVRADSGEVYTGAEASVVVLALTARYAWLGQLLASRCVFPVVRWVYPLVAANRQRLSRVLLRRGGCGCGKDRCGMN
jgi:predicted DCC family thiol-disulfide oxidoreductase YuxK